MSDNSWYKTFADFSKTAEKLAKMRQRFEDSFKGMCKNITKNYDISKTSKNRFWSMSCLFFQKNTLKF